MTKFEKQIASFQLQITCCDDRIKSCLREGRTWDQPQIVREMAVRSGLIQGATIVGIPAAKFDYICWTGKVINEFLASLDD